MADIKEAMSSEAYKGPRVYAVVFNGDHVCAEGDIVDTDQTLKEALATQRKLGGRIFRELLLTVTGDLQE